MALNLKGVFALFLVGATLLLGYSDGTKPKAELGDGHDADVRASGEVARTLCADAVPTRRALFGDLHVHTALSIDAYLFNARTTPSDAYRFSKGETIRIAPLDVEGRGTNAQTIDRPLDFAAVTDHAENFGPVSLCTRPDSPTWDTPSCRFFRGDGDTAQPRSLSESGPLIGARVNALDADEVCGEDGRRCRDAMLDFWGEIQNAAERHYDRSEGCAFTTFVAYEYSLAPALSKVHRNVVFRNDIVLDRPIHALDEPEPS